MANVPIKSVAERLGITVRHALRLVKKHGRELGIAPQLGSRNAVLLKPEDAERLVAAFQSRGRAAQGGAMQAATGNGYGYFYLIQLHPADLPERVKIGFTDNIQVRLSDHRTAAPTLKLLRSWPCKRIWDRAAMDSITRTGCRPVGGEVFDGALEGFLDRAEAFFSLMPRPDDDS